MKTRFYVARRQGCTIDYMDVVTGVDWCRVCTHGDVEYVLVVDAWLLRALTPLDRLVDTMSLYVVFRRMRGVRTPLLEDVAACIMASGDAWLSTLNSSVWMLDEERGVVVVELWGVRPSVAKAFLDDAETRVRATMDIDEVLYQGEERRYRVEVFWRDPLLERMLYSVAVRGPMWDHVDNPHLSRVYPMVINGEPYVVVTNVEELSASSYVALKMLERSTPIQYIAGLDTVSEVGVFRVAGRVWRSRRVATVEVTARSLAEAALQGIARLARR